MSERDDSSRRAQIPTEMIQRVRDATDLAALVALRVPLKKKGPRWWGCCPVHDEKTPSFTVHQDGFFVCFGCGFKGDAISWMTKIEGLDFPDAVRELADRAGIEISEAEQTPAEKERAEQIKRIYQLQEAAAKWFAHALRGSLGERVLLERNLDEAVYLAAGVGYALESTADLCDHLARVGHLRSDIIASGLGILDEKLGRPRDRFRSRLIFPIRDRRGRVVAFGGRDLTGHSKAKYINSPESPVYSKSRELYGADIAARAAGRAGRVVVVEGYFDVLACRAAGIDEAVAPCGTSISEGHWLLLRRMAGVQVLALDGDKAGRRAAGRSLLGALKQGCRPDLAAMPDGLDPDDLLRKHGAESLRSTLLATQPLLRLELDEALSLVPTDALRAAAVFLRELQPADRVDWGRYVAQRLGVDSRLVDEAVRSGQTVRAALPAPAAPDDALPPSEARLIGLAAQSLAVARLALDLGSLNIGAATRQGLEALSGGALLSLAAEAAVIAGRADPVPDDALGGETRRALLALMEPAAVVAAGDDDGALLQAAKAQAERGFRCSLLERLR